MLYEITYKGRTRVVAFDKSPSFPGSLSDMWVRCFKYKYEHPVMPPMIWENNGKTYLMPLWKEVVNGTTINDIEWIKPVKKKTVVEEFKFESASSGSLYTTKKFTKPSGEIKYSCTCPGVYRAKDKQCKHIKELKAKA